LEKYCYFRQKYIIINLTTTRAGKSVIHESFFILAIFDFSCPARPCSPLTCPQQFLSSMRNFDVFKMLTIPNLDKTLGGVYMEQKPVYYDGSVIFKSPTKNVSVSNSVRITSEMRKYIYCNPDLLSFPQGKSIS
jgi:hypothetical protein